MFSILRRVWEGVPHSYTEESSPYTDMWRTGQRRRSQRDSTPGTRVLRQRDNLSDGRDKGVDLGPIVDDIVNSTVPISRQGTLTGKNLG